jgi:hypothetical protein
MNVLKTGLMYHFEAVNNEIISFIYLLKDRLFQVETTKTLDRIISYKIKRNKIKKFVKLDRVYIKFFE